MNKIYILLGVLLVIIGAYWVGGQISMEKCRAEFAIKQSADNQNIHKEIVKTKRKINAETYGSDIVDIRNRLREKYTIR